MKFKYPVYAVIWDDAESDSSWRTIDELHLKPSLALTFGFLLASNEDYVIIGDSYFVEATDKTISNTTKIPRGMIRSMVEVNVAEKKKKSSVKRNQVSREVISSESVFHESLYDTEGVSTRTTKD